MIDNTMLKVLNTIWYNSTQAIRTNHTHKTLGRSYLGLLCNSPKCNNHIESE